MNHCAKKSLLLSTILLASSQLASAANYVGIGYFDLDISGYSDDLEVDLTTLKFNSAIDDAVSIEARIAVGNSGDSFTVSNTNNTTTTTHLDFDIDEAFSIMGKLYLFQTPTVKPYGLIGLTAAETTIVTTTTTTDNSTSITTKNTDTDTKTDMSFALGVDVLFQQKYVLNFEFGNYYDEDGIEAKGMLLTFSSSY